MPIEMKIAMPPMKKSALMAPDHGDDPRAGKKEQSQPIACLQNLRIHESIRDKASHHQQACED
jgi:hypothetical protein